MSLGTEIEGLRRRLDQLAGEVDAGLTRRYALRPLPGERPGPYRRFRRSVGHLLRRLGLRAAAPLEPWLPGLKHVEQSEEARALVIWALGADRETLRNACRGFQALQPTLANWMPVLVTDVADFAFFSRLGWLVEYVPPLAAPGSGFAARKQRYLAWRYRDARAVPVSAGLRANVRAEDLLLD